MSANPSQEPYAGDARLTSMVSLALPNYVEVSTERWSQIMRAATIVGNALYHCDGNEQLLSLIGAISVRRLASLRAFARVQVEESSPGCVAILRDDLSALVDAAKDAEKLLQSDVEGPWIDGNNRVFLARFQNFVGEMCEELAHGLTDPLSARLSAEARGHGGVLLANGQVHTQGKVVFVPTVRPMSFFFAESLPETAAHDFLDFAVRELRESGGPFHNVELSEC